MFTAYILVPEGKIVSYAPSREYAQALVDAPIGSVLCICRTNANSFRVKAETSSSAGYAWATTNKQTKNAMAAFMLLHGITLNSP